LNSHCRDDLLFPYNEWQWRPTLWSRWQWRCRCRLARYCYPSRTTSNPVGACSPYPCVEQHAPSRIRYCSLRSWGWLLCKVRATQLHHRKVLPKPATIAITLLLVRGQRFTIYYSRWILRARSELCGFNKKFIKCDYMTDAMQLLILYKILLACTKNKNCWHKISNALPDGNSIGNRIYHIQQGNGCAYEFLKCVGIDLLLYK
jgi:hypothetical protein